MSITSPEANRYLRYHLIALGLWGLLTYFVVSHHAAAAKDRFRRTVTLSTNPGYEYSTGKGHSNYWITLMFYTPVGPFRIEGLSDAYLNHPEFIKAARLDSTITIEGAGSAIDQLYIHNHSLIDSRAAAHASHIRHRIDAICMLVLLGWMILPILVRLFAGEILFVRLSRRFVLLTIIVLMITSGIVFRYYDADFLEDGFTKYPVADRGRER